LDESTVKAGRESVVVNRSPHGTSHRAEHFSQVELPWLKMGTQGLKEVFIRHDE
jgi:hypothetical protein